MKQNAIRILLVDDHALVRAGVCRLFDEEPDIEVVAQAGSGAEAIRQCAEHKPDLVLLDLGLPDMDGIDVIRQLVAATPRPKVVILTMHTNEQLVMRAFQAGASGYTVKTCSSEDILKAVRTVAGNGAFVTPSVLEKVVANVLCCGDGEDPLSRLSMRECEVLVELARGATMEELSRNMHIARTTVETHRTRILKKLKLRNDSDLTRFAINSRLIRPD